MGDQIQATQLTWSVNDTANRTLSFATGLFDAATSDHISASTLESCGALGAQLPVCSETRLKVEQLARPKKPNHVLNFVKAQIGYSKGDSVEVFSRSDSGIRFLSLAATFYTMEQHKASVVLDMLLQETQKDNPRRPTIKHLQEALKAFETKMAVSDYAKSIVGYEIMARSVFADHGDAYKFRFAEVPSNNSLFKMILALSRIGRIGETSSIEIKLRPQQVPWTLAFVRWCLGIVPNVRALNGMSMIEQLHSLVNLTVLPQKHTAHSRKRRWADYDEVQVSLVQSARDLREVITFQDYDSQTQNWQGLVDAKTWFDHRFSIFFDRFPQLNNNQELKSAFLGAVYSIVTEVPDRLVLCDRSRLPDMKFFERRREPRPLLYETSPKPFLNRQTRLEIARDLIPSDIKLKHVDHERIKILQRRELAKILGGSCKYCRTSRGELSEEEIQSCTVRSFLDELGMIGSTLLTCSLFGSFQSSSYPLLMGGLMSSTQSHRCRMKLKRRFFTETSDHWHKLVAIGWQNLMHDRDAFLSCHPVAIFKHAAELMGHQKIGDSTVISSKTGQVLYPAFFEADDFLRDGYMQLCAFPGKLHRDNMQFDALLDDLSNRLELQREDVSEDESYERIEPSESDDCGDSQNSDHEIQSNAGPTRHGIDRIKKYIYLQSKGLRISPPRETNTEVGASEPTTSSVPRSFRQPKPTPTAAIRPRMWKITVTNNLLSAELHLTEAGGPTIAWSLIESLARTHLTRRCKHKVNRTAGELGDDFAFSQGPGHAIWPAPKQLLYAVGREYGEQLDALTAQKWFQSTVVHVEGCIRCALQLCVDSRSRIVIS